MRHALHPPEVSSQNAMRRTDLLVGKTEQNGPSETIGYVANGPFLEEQSSIDRELPQHTLVPGGCCGSRKRLGIGYILSPLQETGRPSLATVRDINEGAVIDVAGPIETSAGAGIGAEEFL